MSSEQSYPKANALNLSKQEVFKKAEQIAIELEYSIAGDLSTIVTKLGGSIEYVNLEKWYKTQDASIVVHAPDSFQIYISNFTGFLRNRFSIAHELGHYFLHSNKGERKIIAARNGSNPCEWEANWFAAAFLMPNEKFKEVIKKYNGDMDYVAAHFLVSRKAADVRHQSII